jgi:3-hydroxyacyl-CoA dehydrogenase
MVNYPPVNALGRPVKEAIEDTLATVIADDSIAALVIACEGRTYFAGADIKEFGKPSTLPNLPDLVGEVELCPKPVITAIHGSALGGGLEVAMACHFRLAHPDAKFGLPEVKLGLLPGAGGTQRLPRLVGTPKALDMLINGAPIGAAEALEIGLIDAIVDGDLVKKAVEFAESVISEGRAIRRTREREEKLADVRADPGIIDRFEAENRKKFRNQAAPPAILKAVRGILYSEFTKGIALERAQFLSLRDGPQAAAMRHAFFAEREAAKIPSLSREMKPRPIERIGIVGSGTMGTGIAINFLNAGLPVCIVERSADVLERGVQSVHNIIDRNVSSGRQTAESGQRARALLSGSLDFVSLSDADLVIEAAYELMDIKLEIFKRLSAVAKPDAILATNTSYLDIDEIAAATSRPGLVLGLHFFSPANVMKLVEVVRGDKTTDTTLATAVALVKRIGKIAVVAGNAYGFIGNRMLAVRRREAEAMILEGASPYDVDRVAEAFGLAMGPFRVGDLAGLDLGWTPENSKSETIRERLCEAGRRGQKVGAGFYDYESGKPVPSSEAEEIVRKLSKDRGIARRAVDDAEILARLNLPLINEGARILEDGKAFRASDIDVVWLNGYGWPIWTGGPMFHADQFGLASIVDQLSRINVEPAGLLRRLALEGKTFAGFDAGRG